MDIVVWAIAGIVGVHPWSTVKRRRWVLSTKFAELFDGRDAHASETGISP